MNEQELPRFAKGDKVVFLGSQSSKYGHLEHSDRFIDKFVTIKDVHKSVRPFAYRIEEEGLFWFDESCFQMKPQDLPEFEASCELNKLLF